jgi:hypothetical protein
MLMIAEARVPQLLVPAFDPDYAWPFHSALSDVFEDSARRGTALGDRVGTNAPQYPRRTWRLRVLR